MNNTEIVLDIMKSTAEAAIEDFNNKRDLANEIKQDIKNDPRIFDLQDAMYVAAYNSTPPDGYRIGEKSDYLNSSVIHALMGDALNDVIERLSWELAYDLEVDADSKERVINKFFSNIDQKAVELCEAAYRMNVLMGALR